MNKGNKKLKIALIGPYPPPYGGIAIHIQRMKNKLEKEGHSCTVYELGRHDKSLYEKNIIRIKSTKRWLLKYLLTTKEDMIHYHNTDWRMRIIMGLIGLLGKKVIISIHGESLSNSLKGANWIKKQIIKFALKHISLIIVLNPDIKELTLSLGVKLEHIKIIPSFIPPVVKEREIEEIPKKVWEFIDSHRPIILANAFRISFYNNQDLYGIDMCIDLCTSLKQNYRNIGFIFCLPDIGDYEYFNEMKQRIKERGIEKNFLFQTKPCQMYPIIMKSDVFVRPTNTDGFGISIAEAIFFKVPAIASDVCKRAEGTILFRNRDIGDFTLKVRDVLGDYEKYKKRLETVKTIDNSEKIIEIYKKLLN